MIEVRVHQEIWRPIRFMAALKSTCNGNPATYELQCGLSISINNITSPKINWWSGEHYVIRFDNEEDAAWFVLAVGGEICR